MAERHDIDLHDWLTKFELEHYETTLLNYGVSLKLLPILTEENFIQMGISPADTSVIIQAALTLRIDSQITNESIDNREIRQLIFLICDVVNSTQYHSGINLEKSDAFSREYHSTISKIIDEYNGIVVRSTGDGFEAIFGYPVYTENSAEQAIFCGLKLTEELCKLHSNEFNHVGIRVGIACGETIIQKFDGNISSLSSDNFGIVAYRAARLQKMASRDEVFVDENIWSATHSLFNYVSLGKKSLKGFINDHPVWKAVSSKNISSRFERRHKQRLFVGRDKEISVLRNALNIVNNHGRTQIGYIWGEAGVGKSRLTHELIYDLNETASSHVVFQCDEKFQDSPFYPILEHFKRILNIVQSTRNIRTELEEFLSEFSKEKEMAYPVLAHLLGATTEQFIKSPLSMEKQERLVFDVFTEYITLLSTDKTLLLVFEDVHWADNSTVNTLNYLAKQIKNEKILICLTSRSEPKKGELNIQFNFIEEIKTLNRDSAIELLKHITKRNPINSCGVKQILEYSEGNPLYIEELAATANFGNVYSTNDDSITLTSLLKGSLLARLDNLNQAKELAQAASLIGRSFNISLLREIVNLSDKEFDLSLQSLNDENILSVDLRTNTGFFKHALLQNASQRMLPSSVSARYHLKIANALENRVHSTNVPQHELLAHHYTEAKDYANAVRYWLKHGEKLANTWAKIEAASVFERALKLTKKLDYGLEKTNLEMNVLVELGDVLYAHYGYLIPNAKRAYDRSLALSHELNNKQITNRVLDGMFGIKFNAGEFDNSIKIGEQLCRFYEESNYFPSLVLGKQFQGMGRYHLADFISAEELLESCLSHVDRAEEVGSHYPSMPLIYLAWTKFKLGKNESALKLYQKAATIAETQSDYQKAASYGNGCILYSMMGDESRVGELVGELLQISEKFGFKLWNNIGTFFQGWLLAIDNDASGILQMQELVDSMVDQVCDKTLFLGLLAASYANLKDNKNAGRVLNEAISLGEITGEKYYFDELYSLKKDLS